MDAYEEERWLEHVFRRPRLSAYGGLHQPDGPWARMPDGRIRRVRAVSRRMSTGGPALRSHPAPRVWLRVVRGGRLNRVPHTSGEQGRDAPLVPWGRQWPWSNDDPNPDGLLENIAADWADAVEGRHVTWAEVWSSHSEVVSNASRLGANGDERQELTESSRPRAWKRWR